jgi:hypothetical protein
MRQRLDAGLIAAARNPRKGNRSRFGKAWLGMGQSSVIYKHPSITRKSTMKNSTQPSYARPSFFRGLCLQAATGGSQIYARAAYELTRHLGELIDHDADSKLKELSDAISRPAVNSLMRSRPLFLASDDAQFVLDWFKRELPRCMALVPARRHRTFLEGVYQYVIEDENNVTHY